MLFVFITDCIAPRKNRHIYFRLLYVVIQLMGDKKIRK